MRINYNALVDLLNEHNIDYQIKVDKSGTIGDIIFNYLFSETEGIQKNKNVQIPERTLMFYERKIKEQVDKGLPIDFFLTKFSPKFKYEHLTGFHIYPDFSDLFSIVHLHRIAKEIRKVFPYNLRFFVVFSGDLYKNIGMWSDDELEKTKRILNQMIKFAEDFTGIRNSVFLIEWGAFFKDTSYIFKDAMYQRAESIYNDSLTKKNKKTTAAINSWIENMGIYFRSKHKDTFYNEFFRKEISKMIAVEELLFENMSFLDIINRELKANLLASQNKADSKFLSFDTDPFFDNYDYLKVSVLDNGIWKRMFWEEISNVGVKPVYYFSDNEKDPLYDYEEPLYFEK